MSLTLIPAFWPLLTWYHQNFCLMYLLNLSHQTTNMFISPRTSNFPLLTANTLCLPFTARLPERDVYANGLHFTTSHFLLLPPQSGFYTRHSHTLPLPRPKVRGFVVLSISIGYIFRNAVYSHKCLWNLWVAHSWFPYHRFRYFHLLVDWGSAFLSSFPTHFSWAA